MVFLIPDPRLPIPVTGGAGRDRTDDPLLAKQVLSQLSYSPLSARRSQRSAAPVAEAMVLLTAERCEPTAEPGGSGWIRTIDPRLIKTML